MRARTSTALSLAALAACVLAVGFSAASFTDTTQNPQTVSALADFLGPSASASVIAKTQSGAAGYIKAGGTYYVYANVTDSGNPASGIASVKADVSAITTGQTAVPLVAGSYTVGGVTYNYRSASLTAKSGLTAGSKTYSLTLADSAGNSNEEVFSVTALGSFRATGFETANVAGGAEGKPEKGDTVSFEFNNPPEPSSIVSGWSGAEATAVTVTIEDTSSEDTLKVNVGGSSVLGSVNLRGDYVNSGKTATFSSSTMTLSGSTLTLVLGSEPSGNAKQDTAKHRAVWTPVATILDLAANACSTSSFSGGNVKQF
jgi:hypothetical protein